MITQAERDVLRSLGAQLAEIAALPVQAEKIALWRALNDLKPVRPMVSIDQIAWHEMNDDGSLTCQIEDPLWRGIEREMRRTLYKWRRFPADMVVEGFVRIPMAISDTGFGLDVIEETAATDVMSDVVGHAYTRQIDTEADIEKIQTPQVTHDEAKTKARLQEAQWIFDGVIPVKSSGSIMGFMTWDRLIERMGVEQTLYDLVDRPEFIHAVLARWTEASLSQVDQYERLGLLDATLPTCHCTYTFNSQLPGADYDPAHTRTQNCWASGAAQIFSTVGPGMFEEFELQYAKRFYERFGLVNYGCCEPLHSMLDMIMKYIPNARKVSVSPWADVDISAQKLGGRAILCRKPNPAFLAGSEANLGEAGREMERTLKAAKENGCAAEFVLKDLSTLGYEPERLTRWEQMAMRMVADY